MFEINQIHDLAGKAILAISRQRETGGKDMREVESALAEFCVVWNSEECKRYMRSFGTVAVMAQTERREGGKENPEFYAYSRVFISGEMIEVCYRAGILESKNLFSYLFEAYTMSEAMEDHEKVIDAAFMPNPRKPADSS